MLFLLENNQTLEILLYCVAFAFGATVAALLLWAHVE